MENFLSLKLEETLFESLAKINFKSPTPIQAKAIPIALDGKDILGTAQTGTGKTGAFGIPLVNYLLKTKKETALVMTPTRELATQVMQTMNNLIGRGNIRTALLIGGDSMQKQLKQMRRNPRLIVGTPGRINDHLKRKTLKLNNTSFLVLDESDRMLDMGFFPDILWCLERLTNRQQTLLFSATFPQEVLEAANEFISDAEHIMSDDLDVEVPEIDQFMVRIGRANKLWVLGRLMVRLSKEDQVIIFTNTKRMVDLLVERLDRHRFSSTGLHGDMAQNKRERIISDFRDGKTRVVIATDVAARGLDVDGVTMVVNYDIPSDSESYVHRIGRTGRMGRKGEAWSFVSGDDAPNMTKIISTWNMVVKEVEAPELPEGVDRDPVRKQMDWGESADVFGMVPLRLSTKETSKLAIHCFVTEQARLPDLAIGQIRADGTEAIVEIHREKAQHALDALKGKSMNGSNINVQIAN